MAYLFYCKNEDDFKKVVIHIFKSELCYNCVESALEHSKIYSCTYKEDKEIECCDECDEDVCVLCDKLDSEKNIYKDTEVSEPDVDYPLVVVYDSDLEDTVQYFSMSEIKENTKYGIE